MKRNIPYCGIIFLLLFLHAAIAQNNDLKFNLVEGPNGTPLGKINAITQDRFGYIWLAGNGNKCKPTEEGTGLGLSMSYDIITKSHGGELRVKSKEGIGTDFDIVLAV
jgi:K+-sensing histidine kinase KdpD